MATLCIDVGTAPAQQLDASAVIVKEEPMLQPNMGCEAESHKAEDDVTHSRLGTASKRKRRRKKRTGREPIRPNPVNTESETKEHTDDVPVPGTGHRSSTPDLRTARSECFRTSEDEAIDWLNVNLPLPLAKNNLVLQEHSYRLEAPTSIRGVPRPTKLVTGKRDRTSSGNAASSQADQDLGAANLRIADLMNNNEHLNRKIARLIGRLHVMDGAFAQLWRSLQKARTDKTNGLASSREILQDLVASKKRCAELERFIADNEKKAKDQDQNIKAVTEENLVLERRMALQKVTVERLIKTQARVLSVAMKGKARAERRAEKRGTAMAAAAIMDNLSLRRDLPALFETEEMVQASNDFNDVRAMDVSALARLL